ncbi:unnamed protein product [Brassica rapa subsp. trilocularis]
MLWRKFDLCWNKSCNFHWLLIEKILSSHRLFCFGTRRAISTVHLKLRRLISHLTHHFTSFSRE